MKRWILPALLVVSLGVNIGFLLHWAWPWIAPARAAGTDSGWHAGPMRRHLGLSSGQARQMEGERRQVLAQAKPLQDELRRQRRGLFMLMKGKEVREADLDATLNEIARLQAAIEKTFVLHSLKVRSNFSPAQLRKYESYLERGLCPGMMVQEACPPGRMTGHGDCESGAGKKK
jgi:hypothetical protein